MAIKTTTKNIRAFFKDIHRDYPKVAGSLRHSAARGAMAQVIRKKKKSMGKFGMRAKLSFPASP